MMAAVTTPPSSPAPATPCELAGARVFVAGHRGMVGVAVARRLASEGCELLGATSGELDLRRQAEVERWMDANRPDVVILAAGKVGGVYANDTRPAEFLYDNLLIEANLIEAARAIGVRKLVFLGSSCIYPRDVPQPMAESALLTGPLEPTNQWYAVAKIAGIKLAQAYRLQHGCDFISVQPTNLYGPGDNFDLTTSHVVPALIRKALAARDEGAAEIVVWGSGRPLREFLYVEDLADAIVFLTRTYSDAEFVNIGSGKETSIRELAETICEIAEFDGRLTFDADKPDGVMRKLVDSSRLTAMGWRPSTDLRDGLTKTVRSFEALQGRRAGCEPALLE